MKGRFGNFLELSLQEKLLFSEALLFQIISGLILWLVPFRMIPEIYRLPVRLRSEVSTSTSQISFRNSEIKKSIKSSSGFSAWRNKCMVQSLAARWMLNRRSISSRLSIGFTFDAEKKFIAHAWLKTSDFEIVEKNGDYKELYNF